MRQTALVNYWGHTLDAASYIPDPLGLRTNLVRSLGLTTNFVNVGYDNIGQLTSWSGAETSGGLKHLKNMSAPYMHLGLKFIPLGGLDQNNLASYLADPSVAAVGGSWIAKRETIKANDWAAITAAAAKATETILCAVEN